MKKRVLVLNSLIAIGFLTLSSCQNKQAEQAERKPVRVKTIEALKSSEFERIHASGKLSLKEETLLSFKVGGIINSIYVNEGDKVKDGQLLGQLKLSEINANVMQARLAFEKAERDYKRVESLYKDSVATLENFQNASTALDYAKTNLTIAEFNMEYASIKAPANGWILRKLAQENEVKGAGNPVFIFASTEKDWVMNVNLSDRHFILVKLGDSAEIQFDAYPGKIFNALLTEKAGIADPYTGTYACELTILQPDTEFATGFIGKANIRLSNKEELIEIPYNAIVEGNELNAKVFVIVNGKAESRQIEIKRLGQDKVLIKKGLKEGEYVVTDGTAYLKDGIAVEVKSQ